MKSNHTLLTLLVAAGCFCVSVTGLQAQDHDAMIAAAEAMDEAFIAAFNSGDTEAVSAMYWNSPDLVSFPPGSMAEHGYEAVTTGWKAFVESSPGAKLEFSDPVHVVAGEYVVTYGLFKLTIPTPDGGANEMNGRYTDLKGRRDGKWVYVHDHASVPLPPPPSEE